MRRTVVVAVAALSIAVLGAGMAEAQGGGKLRLRGDCSASSEYDLRVIPRGATYEVRWIVDPNKVGDVWNMSVTQNGSTLISGTRTSDADGEAELRVRNAPNAAGADSFSATATNPSTGETCSVQGSI